jgi:predicted nucleic acid-binding protein
MIVLDTNVISELMRKAPSSAVQQWLARTLDQNLVTTVITIAEIEYGIARLPQGSRSSELAERFGALTDAESGMTVLPLNDAAARRAGHFRYRREALGLGAQFADLMIAGIAADVGAAVATRHVADFSGVGIEVIDPWAGSG